jgi:hypothetical protein
VLRAGQRAQRLGTTAGSANAPLALIEEASPLGRGNRLDADRHDTGSVATVMDPGDAGAGSKNFMGASGA